MYQQLLQCDVHEYHTFCDYASRLYHALIPEELQYFFREESEGKIHFVVPSQFSYLPFEALALDLHNSLFLGNRYAIGTTILHPSLKDGPKIQYGSKNLHLFTGGITSLDSGNGEKEAIKKGFSGAVRQIRKGGKEHFVTTLKQASICHFIGHSQFHISGDMVKGLLLEGGEVFTLEDIETLKKSTSLPMLFFANSCQSAATDSSEDNTGILEAFHSLSIPAVIGTIKDIENHEASLFSKAFYHALGHENGDSGEALLKARIAFMRSNPNNSTPLLYRMFGSPISYENNRYIEKALFQKVERRNRQKVVIISIMALVIIILLFIATVEYSLMIDPVITQ